MIPLFHALETGTVQSGSWALDAGSPTRIEIRGMVELFDSDSSQQSERTIVLHEGSRLVYRSLRSDACVSKVRFEVAGAAKLTVRAGFFGMREAPIEAIVDVDVVASGTHADIEILGLAFESGTLDIDGILSIAEGCREVVGSIRETNVFLGEAGSIRGVPSLKVRSDDVKASHSCTIERLSDEHRFYLEGRGLSPQEAKAALLEGKIMHLYEGLPEEMLEAIRSQFIDRFSHA